MSEMFRGVKRRPDGAARAGGLRAVGTRRRPSRSHLLRVLGLDTRAGAASFAILFFVFLLVTLAFDAAIKRHDVELSFDQLAAFERHVQTFGNRTVYTVDLAKPDGVLSQLNSEDWTKLSWKIEFILFMYEDIFASTKLSHDDLVQGLIEQLEGITPHGYGIALYSCGCMVHNVLFQHVSARFGSAVCAMLPGFVFPPKDVRWVEPGLKLPSCAARDEILAKEWYQEHSWRLKQARTEFGNARQHLNLVEHPDRLSEKPT